MPFLLLPTEVQDIVWSFLRHSEIFSIAVNIPEVRKSLIPRVFQNIKVHQRTSLNSDIVKNSGKKNDVWSQMSISYNELTFYSGNIHCLEPYSRYIKVIDLSCYDNYADEEVIKLINKYCINLKRLIVSTSFKGVLTYSIEDIEILFSMEGFSKSVFKKVMKQYNFVNTKTIRIKQAGIPGGNNALHITIDSHELNCPNLTSISVYLKANLSFKNFENHIFEKFDVTARTSFNEVSKLNFSSCEMLKITGQVFETIPPSCNTPKLKELNLSSNSIRRVENMRSLKSLKNLDLSHNHIETLENFDELTALEHLSLELNEIKKIRSLDNMRNLTNLNLSTNLIFKIENLDSLINLNTLDLSNCQILVMDNLKNLINLETLILNENRIFSIGSLETLKKLKVLELSGNEITMIGGLSNSTALTRIVLFENKIERIQGLDSLINLETLDISDNKITKIENLENLKKLEVLQLNSNKITRVENLSQCKKLRIIELQENKINYVPRFTHDLPQLRYLGLEGNNIASCADAGEDVKIQMDCHSRYQSDYYSDY